MNKRSKPKIIVIVGPTATGKSALAVRLARKFDAEIISADSRQVYKGLNIGTGKITKKEMAGVTHYMLDVTDPKKQFTVAEFQGQARKNLQEIFSRNKIPIICGGTGFYISAFVDNLVFPEVPPNKKLRAKFEKKSAEELFKILKKLDRRRADEIDPLNKRRLVRAIEVAKALGKVPRLDIGCSTSLTSDVQRVLWIGLTAKPEELRNKINIRLLARIKKGMINEARKLRKRGLSWKRMKELGLEYRYLARFLQKKISKSEMINKLETEIWHYARRQITWFRRDKRIKWFSPNEINKIEKTAEIFLK